MSEVADEQVSDWNLKHDTQPAKSDSLRSDQQVATAPDSQGGRKPVSFYMSLICLGLLALIVAWDATALAVAIPIIAELEATTLEAFFASIAFTLAVAISQPLYLSILDAIGRKVPLYVAMVLFTVGSIHFAVSQSITVVIAGHLIQGFGGINLPFVGPSIPLALLFMNLRPIDMDLKTKLRRLDWGGMFLFTVGATCISLPVSWADTLYSWSSWQTLFPLIIGIAAFITFGIYEARL
ncbi:hypothetical protein F4810DRAFT_679838 [Camillea tinctor]|nr:hypothetical protein F4810DRAFT_679838 [Camillea tinctor]